MPRTTLDIDATVLRELKQRQKKEKKSLGQLASELLAGALAESQESDAEPWVWEGRPMGGLLVDIEDKDALYRILDAELIEDLKTRK
jgi:hypothetical protein